MSILADQILHDILNRTNNIYGLYFLYTPISHFELLDNSPNLLKYIGTPGVNPRPIAS